MPKHKYEAKLCKKCASIEGGKKHRESEVKRKGSFGDQHPLLAKEWHPTLNGDVTPYDITSGCGDYFYWQCKYGHVFQTSPSERVKRHAGCPTCRTSLRTSFTEQAIAFYLSKVVEVNQHFKQGGFNFDIFIDPFKTVVEYDGMFWHAKADTANRDARKDKYCKKRGWRIIRVKESEKINRVDGNRIYAQRRNTDYVWLINQVCNLLGVLPPTDINIERDTPEIYARVNPVAKEGSLADKKPELLKYWDKEANLPVTPDMVTPFSHLAFSWHCPDCGHEWTQRLIEISNRKIKCPQCREKAFAKKGLKSNG
jgi:DNA-directed RNA polymerase subunit RPC12/RpoP